MRILIENKVTAQKDLSEKISKLPPELIKTVENFVDMISEQKTRTQPEKQQRTSGQLKGKVWMSPDFNEPLEDLKDYM